MSKGENTMNLQATQAAIRDLHKAQIESTGTISTMCWRASKHVEDLEAEASGSPLRSNLCERLKTGFSTR